MTVGEGKNTIVYTYGRYLGGDKGKSSSNSYDPSGRGVMIRLSGKEAQHYLKHELKDMKAKAYEITDASDKKVQEHFDKQMSSGRKLTKEEAKSYDSNDNKYGTSEDARVVDKYSLLSNKCTTKAIDGAQAGGTKEDFEIIIPETVTEQGQFTKGEAATPSDAKAYLDMRANQENSNVKDVTEKKGRIKS
jgi:hypothetical protein